MKAKTETFIAEHFNDNTVDKQILKQESIISNAQREIERLRTIAEEQKGLPWYDRDGLSFRIYGYNHYDGYRSYSLDPLWFTNYKDFIVECIRHTDPDLDCDSDSTDFYIYAPVGGSLMLEYEGVKELPLIAEYFERKELIKNVETYQKERDRNLSSIASLDRDIYNTAKYTESYIKTLKDKQNELKESNSELEKTYLSSDTFKRIEELNNQLKEIDTRLNDEEE